MLALFWASGAWAQSGDPVPGPDADEGAARGEDAPAEPKVVDRLLPRYIRERSGRPDRPRGLIRLPKEKEAPPGSTVDGGPTEIGLWQALEDRYRHLRAGNKAGAQVALARLEQLADKLKLRNFVGASTLFLAEARQALAEERYDDAVRLADSAVRISPDLLSAHLLRSESYFRRDWTQLRAIAGSLWGAVKSQVFVFRNQLWLLSGALGFLGAAWCLGVAGFLAIQFFKYARYAAHDLSRPLPRLVGAGEVVIALLMLCVLPAVMGWGILISALAVTVVVAAYQSAREFATGAALLIGTAALPFVVELVAPLYLFPASDVDRMYAAATEAFAQDAEARLENETRSKDRTGQVALVLAHRKRHRGDVAGAEEDYRRALSLAPGLVGARNNLGVILFDTGRKEAAKANFEQASASGTHAEPLLNLALWHLDAGRFDEANAYVDRARGISGRLAEDFSARQEAGGTTMQLFEMSLPAGMFWRRLWDVPETERQAFSGRVWRRLGGALSPAWSGTAVLFLCLVLAWLRPRTQRVDLSTACPKCGRAARRSAPAGFCGHCQSIFLNAMAVEPALRLRKEAEVRRFQRGRRWLERGLSLLGGLGLVLAGQPILGVILSIAFFASALMFIGRPAVAHHAWGDVGREGLAWLRTLIPVLCMVLIALLGTLSLRRR